MQHKLLKLSYAPSPCPHHRFAFIISGKLGHAVARNKLRRRLREIMQQFDTEIRLQHADGTMTGHDLILIARSAAMRASFAELRHAIKQLLCRAQLLGQHKQ